VTRDPAYRTPTKQLTGGYPRRSKRLIRRLRTPGRQQPWGLAAAAVLFTFVDPVLLMGLVLTIATVAAAWLGFRELMHRADRDDSEASASHLRPAAAGQRDFDRTSAHTAWRGHHAA
jgi:hypothetical protein